MNKSQKFFYRQPLHYFSFAVLLCLAGWSFQSYSFSQGKFLGLTTVVWFWSALATALLHQTYVWLCWRGELYFTAITRVLGKNGFLLYSVGFFVLLFSRLVITAGLAFTDQGSLVADPAILYGIAGLLCIPMFYTYYSFARYFGFHRAVGIDHFDPAYRNKPLANEGIFKFFRNPLYLFGVLILYLPGLLLGSRLALLVAVFHHLAIWVHYFCTEKPDMQEIYGEVRENEFFDG